MISGMMSIMIDKSTRDPSYSVSLAELCMKFTLLLTHLICVGGSEVDFCDFLERDMADPLGRPTFLASGNGSTAPSSPAPATCPSGVPTRGQPGSIHA